MASRRIFDELRTSTSYTKEQVRGILEEIGVEIVREGDEVFLCYCPFHNNTNTPAFAVRYDTGFYICFNGACPANRGSHMEALVQRVTNKNIYEVRRYLTDISAETSLVDMLDEALIKTDYQPIPQMVVDDLVKRFWANKHAQIYMAKKRGFTKETCEYFEVGYDGKEDSVVVPLHDYESQIVGLNYRSVTGKRFKISKQCPRNHILFNVHRAKKYDKAIICESQFDVMRLHQAGFPNGVCPLGSYVSDKQFALLNRYFSGIIIATDSDKPGREMGMKVSDRMAHKNIEWAVVGGGSVYPNGAKDLGDLTDDEIRAVIKGSISDWEYRMYGVLG